jgi:hypothetical protein
MPCAGWRAYARSPAPEGYGGGDGVPCTPYQGKTHNPQSQICNPGLFPLDGCGGFAGDVVDDAVDASDLVDDPAGDGAEDVVRDVREVGGHEVGRVHGADGDDVLVAALVAHDDEVEAAKARDRKAIEMYGEHVWLNFPLEDEGSDK